MKIDIRLFIVPVAPFVVLAFLRALWFVAGAEWSDPAFGAFFSALSGVSLGGLVTAFLLMENISIGHITIGKVHK